MEGGGAHTRLVGDEFAETGNFPGVGYELLGVACRSSPSLIEEATVGTTAAVEWRITVEGTDAFGEVRRREVRIDKSWDRLFDGEIGLSVEDGKKIMAALQSAVVSQEADAYTLFRRICPDCGVLRPIKDYTNSLHPDRLRRRGGSQSPLDAVSELPSGRRRRLRAAATDLPGPRDF